MIRILKIAFVLFWMILIFCFSLDTGEKSTKKSEGFMIHVTKLLFRRECSQKEIEKYSTIVRKTAHFVIYFCLGGSLMILFQDFHSLTIRDILYTVLIVFLYACTDEIHQTFIEGRTGSFIDVLIDTSGGLVSSLLFYFLR